MESVATIQSAIPSRVRPLAARERSAGEKFYAGATHRWYADIRCVVKRGDRMSCESRNYLVHHVGVPSNPHHLEVDCESIEKGS